MTTAQLLTPRLVTGERMSREEFLARWDLLPDLKRAELIEGVVYVPSPVSLNHSDFDALAHTWLGTYSIATPGCIAGANGTWLMLESAPQPDGSLRIKPECGGQSRSENDLSKGAPELAVEICVTSTHLDFGPKLALYQRAGVKEYITFETSPPRIVWRVLRKGSYVGIRAAKDGILRSKVFPGLWLDPTAFWKNAPRLLEVLQQGLASEEHAKFVKRLAAG